MARRDTLIKILLCRFAFRELWCCPAAGPAVTAAKSGGVRRSGARAQDHVRDGGQSTRLGALQLPRARLALQFDKLEGAVGLNEGLLPRVAVSPVSAWLGLSLGVGLG